MNQLKKIKTNKVPSFKPRPRKNLLILFLCLPLAIFVCTSPLNACVVPDISDGYAASRAPNQLTGDLQNVPNHILLARGGGGGGGRGQGKGGGSGSGQCDGSGSGQGKGKGYGAKDGTGTGERPQDGTGYGAGSGSGTVDRPRDGSGKGSGQGSGGGNR